MTFTRTTSGISNYSAFFGSDITVFVEGKESGCAIDGVSGKPIQTSDELFHNAIFSSFSKSKNIKIKSVGSKNDLNVYAEKISSGTSKNCVVVFDSDYEGVTSTWTGAPLIMRTFGYSWESDLWGYEVCEKLVTLLAGGRNWDRDKFFNRLTSVSNRLKRLSKIEVYCRCYGKNLILPNGKSVGIKFDARSNFLISYQEASRVISKVKSILREIKDNIFANYISTRLKEFPSCKLVRGHLWEVACMTLVVATLKSAGVAQNIATDNLRNVALGVFTQDPVLCLSQLAQEHYQNQILRAGI